MVKALFSCFQCGGGICAHGLIGTQYSTVTGQGFRVFKFEVHWTYLLIWDTKERRKDARAVRIFSTQS